MRDTDLDALAADLAEFGPTEKKGGRPAKEERVVAGFEEIQRFAEKHGRTPRHGEDRDIFERLYAVRLDRLRELPDCRALLEPLDHQGLLSDSPLAATPTAAPAEEEPISIDDLAAELAGVGETEDIRVLRHVRTAAEKRAAEEIANRKRCEDFKTFKPLFERVAAELKTGVRQSQPIEAGRRAIEAGDFFVLDGITLYVAEVGEPLKTTAGEVDSRLRLIFSNGTESNLLVRSLQRAFYNDPAARRLVSPESGQLSFGGELEADDVESGTIYVLRSLSDHPYVAEHRELIHKVGVTGGKVETRVAAAEHDATYLLAKVEVVATYKLAGINRTRMEKLLHRLFAPAQLSITINDRFGHPVQPREWFLVPLFVIDEAVKRIKDGTILSYQYDPKSAQFVRAPDAADWGDHSGARDADESEAAEGGDYWTQKYDPETLSALVVVDDAELPLSKAEILEASGLDESYWRTIAKALREEPQAYFRQGVASGMRYCSIVRLCNVLVEQAEAAGSEGATRRELVAALSELGFDLDDDLWKQAITRMCDEGHLLKAGRGAGVRYRVA